MTIRTKLALASASLLAMGTTVTAHAQSDDLINDLMSNILSQEQCTLDGEIRDAVEQAPSKAAFAVAADAYIANERARSGRELLGDPNNVYRNQVVYLKFGSEDPTFSGTLDGQPLTSGGVPGVFQDYVYTDADKKFVLDSMRKDYARLRINFTLTEPKSGDFSTIRIGDNDANPIDLAGGILFGRADSIDFGNTIRNDGAFADASLWKMLHDMELFEDPTFGAVFTRVLGLEAPTGTFEERKAALAPLLVQAIRGQSANTSSHELGHILGLRHQDSFGGIGEGLPPARFDSEYFPPRDDMTNVILEPQTSIERRVALETLSHIMASGASTGLSITAPVFESRFLSERSSSKLAFNERLTVQSEEAVAARGGRIDFRNRGVTNSLEAGVNANKPFLTVRDGVVLGSLDELGEVDTYKVRLKKGEVFSAEIILEEDGDAPEQTVFAPVVTLVGVNPATGEREVIKDSHWTFEGWSPHMFDVEIEWNGTYEVIVDAPNNIVRGSDLTVFDLESFGLSDFRIGAYTLRVTTLPTPLSREERFPEITLEELFGGHASYDSFGLRDTPLTGAEAAAPVADLSDAIAARADAAGAAGN